jgi:hypothetical protein
MPVSEYNYLSNSSDDFVKSNKIIRYLFGLWIGLQCKVFAFFPLFTFVAPWGLTIKFKIYSYWRWIWLLDGNKDHSEVAKILLDR